MRDTEIANLLVGWGPATVVFHRFNDAVEIVECATPTFALRSHPDTEITSRSLPIRMLQQSDFPVGSVCVARVDSCHVHRYFAETQNVPGALDHSTCERPVRNSSSAVNE